MSASRRSPTTDGSRGSLDGSQCDSPPLATTSTRPGGPAPAATAPSARPSATHRSSARQRRRGGVDHQRHERDGGAAGDHLVALHDAVVDGQRVRQRRGRTRRRSARSCTDQASSVATGSGPGGAAEVAEPDGLLDAEHERRHRRRRSWRGSGRGPIDDDGVGRQPRDGRAGPGRRRARNGAPGASGPAGGSRVANGEWDMPTNPTISLMRGPSAVLRNASCCSRNSSGFSHCGQCPASAITCSRASGSQSSSSLRLVEPAGGVVVGPQQQRRRGRHAEPRTGPS